MYETQVSVSRTAPAKIWGVPSKKNQVISFLNPRSIGVQFFCPAAQYTGISGYNVTPVLTGV